MPGETQTLIPLEENLSTSYSPDREYRDGVLVERNVGDRAHSRPQFSLFDSIAGRETEWNVVAYTELRINVRADWYPLPDVLVFSQPDPQERYPERPPRLWIEILSEKDQMVDVWGKGFRN